MKSAHSSCQSGRFCMSAPILSGTANFLSWIKAWLLKLVNSSIESASCKFFERFTHECLGKDFNAPWSVVASLIDGSNKTCDIKISLATKLAIHNWFFRQSGRSIETSIFYLHSIEIVRWPACDV